MNHQPGVSLQDLMKQMAAMQAELLATKAELASAKSAPPRAISFKVSDKGAISIYGMGRWPITLYKSQFDKLFTDDNIARLREFRKANDHLLSSKD